MMKRIPVPLVLVAALLVLPSVARAENVDVPGDSLNAIQAAVDRAGPGGTVTLLKGDHVLTQTVIISHDGLRIVAQGGAVLLGRSDASGAFLALFSVQATDVQLNGLNVDADPANLGDLSLAVATGAHGLVVTRCKADRIVQLVNAGDANSATITNNKVTTVEPVNLSAPQANLAVIRSAGGGAVEIKKNKLEGLRATGSSGITCLPPTESVHTVDKNKLGGFDSGIRADGAGVLKARKNRVVRCTNGIDMAESTVAVRWVIFKNKVIDNLAAGIYLEDGDNCEITKNTVKGAGTDGINIGGVFIKLQKNKSRLNAGAGIYGATNSCNYFKNKTVRNGRGLRVEGAGNRLRKNRAQRNLGDGVVATGGNVNMGKNKGKRNGGINVSIS
jgi:parallel beta-helix repeat protein